MTNAEYYRQMYHIEVFKMFAELADKLNEVKSTRSASAILRNFLKKTLEYPMTTDEGLVGWGEDELAWRFTNPTTLPDVEVELAANGRSIDVSTYVPTEEHLLQPRGWEYPQYPVKYNEYSEVPGISERGGTHITLHCYINNRHSQKAVKNLVAKLAAERGTRPLHEPTKTNVTISRVASS